MRTSAFRSGAILLSALLFALYARVELPWAWLGWIALVPWLTALDRARSMRAAVGSGAAMAMAFTVGVFAWFADAVAHYTQTPLWLAYGLLLVAGPVLQPQFVVFAAVRHGLTMRGGHGLIVSAAAAFAWVGTEWVFPRLLGDTLGHGLHPFATFRQGADLAGAAGLTFLLLLVNQSLRSAAAQWRGSARRALLAFTTAAALIGALGGYGALRLRQVAMIESPHAPLTVALVQASLDDYDGLRARAGTFGAVRAILDAHTTLSVQALDRSAPTRAVELLLWPETVYPTTFGAPKSVEGAEFDAEIIRFVEHVGVPLLFGTYDRDTTREYNAAVLLEPPLDGAPRRAVYRKRRLFPLTETVPPWLDSTLLRDHLPWLGTWRPGDGPPLLILHRDDGDVALAPLICLDAVDPSLALDAARRGAAMILTLSNDGWFADGRGARLHLTVSAFRSIETRLPQLRVTNTGISAIIGADGGIATRTAVGQATALTATVQPGRRGSTTMTRTGDWFGPVAGLLAPILALVARRRMRRAE